MKIDFLCSDGSPLGPTSKTVYGDDHRIGLGGAELAMITLCETWHKLGHEVTLYNDPWELGASPFEQRYISQFDPKAKRDVLIIFRSPNPLAIVANGFKVWFSCDQYTIGDFKAFAPHAHKIVCISKFHQDYFRNTYQIANTEVIDLPIRLDDLVVDEPIEKENRKCIFTSIPDRGLLELYDCWSTVKHHVPDVTLTITSDYRLWGVGENNYSHRVKWMLSENVRFLGAIPRRDLIKEQLSSELLVYPCTYDELFCISVAEAQCCGIYTITSDAGALPTTNMCKLIPREAPNLKSRFATAVIEALNTKVDVRDIKLKAFARFEPDIIAQQWQEKIFKEI